MDYGLQIEDCGLSEKWRVEDVECRIESGKLKVEGGEFWIGGLQITDCRLSWE